MTAQDAGFAPSPVAVGVFLNAAILEPYRHPTRDMGANREFSVALERAVDALIDRTLEMAGTRRGAINPIRDIVAVRSWSDDLARPRFTFPLRKNRIQLLHVPAAGSSSPQSNQVDRPLLTAARSWLVEHSMANPSLRLKVVLSDVDARIADEFPGVDFYLVSVRLGAAESSCEPLSATERTVLAVGAIPWNKRVAS